MDSDQNTPDKIFDLVIIGGGPCGLFGLFYACIRQLDTLLIDSLPELGGQLTALYPEKDIYDMPGFPKILTKDLVKMMVDQALMHRKQEVVLSERVETLTRGADEEIVLLTDKGRSIRTRTVVITTGAGAFRPNKLPAPLPAGLEGSSILYFVKEPASLTGKRVVVVGGGDSAMDWILALHGKAEQVTLVHRRDVFRAHEDSLEKVRALSDVKQYLFYEAKDFGLSATGELEQLIIENNKTQERLTLNADTIVVSLGFVADMGPVKNWGLNLKANQIFVNSCMETNLPGVYAAGDVATYEGKIKLIATGVGEAAIAVNAAKHYIDPTQRLQPVHSTTLFEKKPPGHATAEASV